MIIPRLKTQVGKRILNILTDISEELNTEQKSE